MSQALNRCLTEDFIHTFCCPRRALSILRDTQAIFEAFSLIMVSELIQPGSFFIDVRGTYFGKTTWMVFPAPKLFQNPRVVSQIRLECDQDDWRAWEALFELMYPLRKIKSMLVRVEKDMRASAYNILYVCSKIRIAY